MNYLVTCGSTDSYGVGTPLDTAAEWSKRNSVGADPTPYVTGALPATADDCLRLCGWVFRESGTMGYTTTCNAWEWIGASTTSGVCTLYPDRSTTGNPAQIQKTTAKVNVIAAGARANGVIQSDFVTSWKRSIFPGEFAGRYKRDLWIEERSEDWMKPDLILRADHYPIA